MAYSAATATAIAALFNPLPAAAAPPAPPVPGAPAVPDMGSRPQALGNLTLPGQQAGSTIPAATAPLTSGVAMTPLLQKIEKQRTEIATLGEKLSGLDEDRGRANEQVRTAGQKVTDARAALAKAEQDVAVAAAGAMRDQAALPPGTLGSGLADLDALAQMQRGESATEEAAARHLAIIRAAEAAAMAEQATATTNSADLTRQFDTLNAEITKKQTALQKLEQQHTSEITAAEAAQSAADLALGQGYLDGASQGRGADPRAVAALTYALAQRGDPYVWSEEGPNRFDCSGLMYAAYRSAAAGGYPLRRVSRDQYDQTRNNSVDRYSLVPGDLLFFSSTNSWKGIHHVAMYAGNGMMVEAPRTGLNVRLVPVRWSRLFQATRVYGSVDGVTPGPDLNALPPPAAGNGNGNNGNGSNTTPPTTPPPSSSQPTRPPVVRPPSKPTTPSQPTSPSTSPSVSPSNSSSPPPASPTADPPASSPSGGGNTSPSNGGSEATSPSNTSSGAQSPSGSKSAEASKTAEASKSAEASKTAEASKSASAAASSKSAATDD